MNATLRLAFLALALALVAPARAQDVPPTDPHAGVGVEVAPTEPLPTGHPAIDDPHAGVPGMGGGAGPGPVTGDTLPSGHPPIGSAGGGGALPSGHGMGGVPGMGGMGDAAISRMFSPPETATAEPDTDLPPGSIRVIVVDENDAPVADAEIEVGIMRSAGDRERLPARSGADGTYLFEGLETGGGQAYRVNVLFEGATYSSTPFQLPPDSGYTSRVRRLPVSHDDQQILQFVAQLFVELRDDRLHVISQVQLVNIGDATYVFPAEGTRIRLPDGFVAFESQAVMTDQHVEEEAGHGLRIRGSLPPGMVMLAWGFDVPTSGDEMRLRVGNPFRTMRYRVISEAPEGLALDVEGFPRARRVDSEGDVLLATELQRRPGDDPVDEVSIRLRGIPGPGPLRLIALGLAIALLLGGITRFVRRPGGAADGARRRLEELGRRKAELFAAARAVEAEHASGEIGDGYRQKRREAIVMELAGLLYREERLKEVAPLGDKKGSVVAPRGGSKSEMKKAGSAVAPKAKKKGGSGSVEKAGPE